MLRTVAAKAGLLVPGLAWMSLCALAQSDHTSQNNQAHNIFPPGATGGTAQKGKPGSGGGVANLIFHGGPVLSSSDFHFVWWGSPSAFTAEQPILQNFVGGLGTTAFYGMMHQYTPSGPVLNYPKNDYVDISAPPSHGPSVSAIVGEVCKVLTAANQAPDPNAIYAVLASNFPKGANYCAWHSAGPCGGTTVQVIYQPNPAGVLGCSTGVYPHNNAQADSTANTLSHEIFEAVTDPLGTAWYDKNGEEIGDKCAWTFTPYTTGANYTNIVGGQNYYIQREWSNLASGCVQQDDTH